MQLSEETTAKVTCSNTRVGGRKTNSEIIVVEEESLAMMLAVPVHRTNMTRLSIEG